MDTGYTFTVKHTKKTIQTIAGLARKGPDLVESVGRKTVEGAVGKNIANTNKNQIICLGLQDFFIFHRYTDSILRPSRLDTGMGIYVPFGTHGTHISKKSDAPRQLPFQTVIREHENFAKLVDFPSPFPSSFLIKVSE